MNIDLTWGSFDLDPMNVLHESCEYSVLYESGIMELDTMFGEASNGANKQNIFQKIWAFIQKGLKWIGKRFSQFVNYVKTLLTGHPQRSIDSILAELHVEPTHANGSISVNIPSNERSAYKPPDVKLMVKPVILKINNDKSMSFNMAGVMGKLDYGNYEAKQGGVLGFGKKIPIRGQQYVGPNVLVGDDTVTLYLLDAMFLLLNPGNFDYLIKIAQYIKDQNFDKDISANWDSFNKSINKYKQNPSANATVTLDQILEFQTKLNDLQTATEILDTPDNVIHHNYFVIAILNQFSKFVSGLQMGINTITATAIGIYQIDASYYESIKDLKTFSKFVDVCVKSSIPSKYIANNVYLVCAPNIKGSKGGENNPIWGQSRVVFFPNDNKGLVYKVALSGWGVKCNKSEYNISEAFKKHGGDYLLAPTLDISTEGTVSVAERVQMLKNNGIFDQSKILKLQGDIRDFCRINKIPLNLGGDLHGGNIGIRHGKFVALDYAYANRE